MPTGRTSVRLPVLRQLEHVVRHVRGPAPAFGARQRLQPLSERRLPDEALEDDYVNVVLAPAPGLGQPIRDVSLPAGPDERAAEVREVRAEPIEAQRAEHDGPTPQRAWMNGRIARTCWRVSRTTTMFNRSRGCAKRFVRVRARHHSQANVQDVKGFMRGPSAEPMASCSPSQSARSARRPSSVVTTSRSRLRSVCATVAAGRLVPARRSNCLAGRSEVTLKATRTSNQHLSLFVH